MKKITLLFVCFIASISLFAQKPFEGHINYTFKIMGEGVEAFEAMFPTSMDLYSDKKGLMVKINGGLMSSMGDVVTTPKESFMVNHSEKTVYMMKADDAEKDEAPKVVKEDEVITINGMSCQKYKVTKQAPTGEQTSYVWISSDYTLPMQGAKGAEGMGVPGVPGIAMKTMTSTGGMTIVLTANEFATGKQNKKYFAKPKGYAKKDFDPNSMMGM